MNTINRIAYYVDIAIAYIGYYVSYLYEYYRGFAPIIKFAVTALTITALLIIIALLSLLFRAWRNRRWRRVEKRIADRYGEGVAYLLSADAKPDMTRQEVLDVLDIEDDKGKTLLKNFKEKLSFCRLVYQTRISENAVVGRRRNLHTMLGIFGTQSFLEELVNKGNDRRKAEALHMLRAFKMPINQWVANQLLNTKRNRIRRLAMYASIMSSSNTDLDYFESEFFDDNCCIYDEIQLGYVLQRRRSAKRKIPNLAHWAHLQKNPSTQCVFVRLMRQFNQKEYCSELEELFNHAGDKQLLEEIARTWGYLHYEEGEELLSDMLLTQPDDTKVAIMHALVRMGTGKSLNALVDGYKNSGDQHVKFEALRCLYNYGEEGRAKFREFERTAQPGIEQRLFEFFHNPITLANIELNEKDVYTPMFGDNIFSVA